MVGTLSKLSAIAGLPENACERQMMLQVTIIWEKEPKERSQIDRSQPVCASKCGLMGQVPSVWLSAVALVPCSRSSALGLLHIERHPWMEQGTEHGDYHLSNRDRPSQCRVIARSRIQGGYIQIHSRRALIRAPAL